MMITTLALAKSAARWYATRKRRELVFDAAAGAEGGVRALANAALQAAATRDEIADTT